MFKSFTALDINMRTSIIFFMVYVAVLVLFLLRTKRKTNSKGIKFLPLFLIGAAVFCLRQGITDAFLASKEIQMVDENKVFFALIETLRTFALDGSYSEVMSVVSAVYNSMAINIYTSLLFILAPVTGGALIIEVVASIYPRIRFVICNRLFVWKEMHYFSELNDSSLALAKSLRNSKNSFTRCCIVFTDVYTDSEERITELYLGAKSIGAICISDDLLHTHLRSVGKKNIYLMDNNEIDNLQALSALSEQKKLKVLRNTKIYLFNSDDTFAVAGCEIEEYIKKRLAKKEENNNNSKGIIKLAKKIKAKLEPQKPKVIPVNGKKNLVRNLFYSLPLYEPLVGENDNKTLNITIMGVGEIGTEAFLSAYWFGQLLDVELCINVVSIESENEFRNKIDYINPDILMTSEPCDLLKIYPDGEDMAQPYFKFRYFCKDLKNTNIDTLLTTENDGFRLASTDYFVVALGSDEDNLAVADKIKKSVATYRLNEKSTDKCVISYVIYNSELCDALNRNSLSSKKIYNGIYMHAFGALDEVYHKKNVFMEDTIAAADEVGKSYDSIKQSVTDRAKNKEKDFYSYWSDIARAAHIKYKVFSAGEVTASVYSECDYFGVQKADLERYKNLYKGDKKLSNRLAWLEHRRWNAYMRACGMRCPEDFTVYSDITNEYKNLDLKLHPCIVECDMQGKKANLFSKETKERNDMLDIVSLNIDKMNGDREDYKKYDYPEYDF